MHTRRPLLVSACAQMRPDVLTLLRFAISTQLFMRLLRASQTPAAHTRISIRSHAQPFFPLNHYLCLTCPLSFSTVSISFDVNISKYQIIKVRDFFLGPNMQHCQLYAMEATAIQITLGITLNLNWCISKGRIMVTTYTDV